MDDAAHIAALGKRVSQQDDRIDGIWIALLDVIDVFKMRDPAALPMLLKRWHAASRDYARLRVGRPHSGSETPDRLEPRALLHDVLSQLVAKTPPGATRAGGTRSTIRAEPVTGSRARSSSRRKEE